LGWFKRIITAIIGNEDFSDMKSSTVRDIINGDILTKNFLRKQYALIGLIAFLTFMYVDNRFYCETQMSRVIELKKKIKDVKYESLTVSAQLMEISRQSSILKLLNEKGLDLKVIETPP
jgi:hypothetical protein